MTRGGNLKITTQKYRGENRLPEDQGKRNSIPRIKINRKASFLYYPRSQSCEQFYRCGCIVLNNNNFSPFDFKGQMINNGFENRNHLEKKVISYRFPIKSYFVPQMNMKPKIGLHSRCI